MKHLYVVALLLLVAVGGGFFIGQKVGIARMKSVCILLSARKAGAVQCSNNYRMAATVWKGNYYHLAKLTGQKIDEDDFKEFTEVK